MHIRINGIRMFFDIDGASLVPDGSRMRDKPQILLLHGGPGYDHSVFKPSFAQLCDLAQLIYVDFRGSGRTDLGDPAAWCLEQWADDVAALCEALEIEKPVVCGVSFGGYVAMQLALQRPELPFRLLLLSTTAQLRIDRALRVFERLGGAIAREAAANFWSEPNAETFAHYQAHCLPLYSSQPVAPEVVQRAKFNRDVLFAFFRSGAQGRTFNLLPELHRIRCPTLVMTGTDDPITTIEDASDICAALPAELVRLEQFPGCRHGVTREDPDRAFRLIREFVTADSPIHL